MLTAKLRNPELLVLPLGIAVAVLLYGLAVWFYQPDDSEMDSPLEVPPATALLKVPARPDFRSMTDVKMKKDAFFSYLLPMIRNTNALVLAERTFLERVSERLERKGFLTEHDYAQLAVLAEKYRVPLPDEGLDQDTLTRLLRRCDVVPASLVMAQAANESAWGTSRFALQGNNFFGIWCFRPGCGLTPIRREAGFTHEVARFPDVAAGVDYYVNTINTNNAYTHLRNIREQLRRNDEQITGMRLAEGLDKYSERGDAYVEEIKSMISFNELSRYTNRTTDSTANSTTSD
ncbi:MAG: glucosaminidase domain-containing protein [Pseudomonadales bacterium]|nr:glucosaminidase domain-containing protein [Pseudomonadales bacterium]